VEIPLFVSISYDDKVEENERKDQINVGFWVALKLR
jgi:hypothetical protein